ncbi:hypothetical protein [Methylobacter sp.]|uniref:hypothetical protein n=1 Tax=Methylobacter sp. TaxID=2051955 RepID=UPI00121382F0|nr:hypothetical protein [Methylobacter sp.]TAK64846.1 MAG: hypothetical protein EPO18_01345 [Methylobacter sp.]
MDQIEENLDSTENKNFFAKLKDGDFGLSTTYWGFGVLGSFVIRFLFSTIGQASASMFLILFAIATVYMGIVWLGIWRAADKFEGNEIWIVASKIMVAIGVLVHINNIFGFI